MRAILRESQGTLSVAAAPLHPRRVGPPPEKQRGAPRPRREGSDTLEAVLIGDEQLRVRWSSKAADRLLQRFRLQTAGARLTGSPGVLNVLRRGVLKALRTDGPVALPLACAPGESQCVCRVLPLYESRDSAPKHVLLMFSVIAQPHAVACAAESYGLTSAELHVANLLVAGFNVREISVIRDTTLHTVRTQLKHLLQKTGTRRQAELVACLQLHPNGEV